MREVYPALPNIAAAAPLWVSCSRATSGKPLSARGIAYLCEQRIGTSKVHSLRHTFAHAMERAGARPSDIHRKLGHTSLATTSIYLDALGSAENLYAADMLAELGVE